MASVGLSVLYCEVVVNLDINDLIFLKSLEF